MKNNILILFIVLFAYGFTNAQSDYQKRVEANVNGYLKKVESKTKLSKSEKETLYTLKKSHTENFWKVSEEFKDSPELAEKRKAVGTAYYQSLVQEFGRDRAKEISIAGR